MILYAHQGIGTPPEVLRGAMNVVSRRTREHYVHGIGQAAFCAPPPSDAADIGDGWVVWVNKDGPAPVELMRPLGWCRQTEAEDQDGNLWSVPVILGADGERAFQVNYDENYLPIISEERADLLAYAKEARTVIHNRYRDGPLAHLPMPQCCRWASAFIEAANHITSRTIGKLGILNDKLVLETLMMAASVDLLVDHG
jgi:hypothetical protein